MKRTFKPLGLVSLTLLLCTFLIVSCTSNRNSKTATKIGYNSKSKNFRPSKKIPGSVANNSSWSRQKESNSNRNSNSKKSRSAATNRGKTRTRNSVPTPVYQSEEFPEYHYENCNNSLSYLLSSRNGRTSGLHMSIDKSEYKLTVLYNGELIKEYPVVFGKNPRGQKLMQGDKKTPEGAFKVRALYPHKSWEKFIWIDYPTAESYQKHRRAKQRGDIPDDAKIGGEIGIHGVPDDKNYAITERQNWTLGCIAMKNQDINELYPYVSTNMSLEIFE